MIYLDYAANTPVDQVVLASFTESASTYLANPNASHHLGRLAKERIERANQQIAHRLGIKSTEIIHTSGATEANNLAIKGIAQSYKRKGNHIITTYLEHASVTSPIMTLQQQGYDVDFVDLDEQGRVDLEHLKELLREDTILVSISYIDSEIGTIQPIQTIRELIDLYPHCIFHVDATQAVGKIPIDLDAIDLLTFAPHKFYGLNGSGVLIKKEGILLEPQIHGGLSTTAYRSGSPALAFIVATETALELAISQLSQHLSHVQKLNHQLRQGLSAYKEVVINSSSHCSPYILNLSLRGLSAKDFQKELEALEIYVATKTACSTPTTPSRPVYALTKDRKLALSTLRISLSHHTTLEEINAFLSAFEICYKKLKK
ncbi:MAG: cysteine desulfurase family protein [Cellulosilyticaceae bacterium]